MTEQQEKAIQELEKIREIGKVNMMSKNRVVEIANEKGYYNIVNEVTYIRKSGTVKVDSKKYVFLLEKMN